MNTIQENSRTRETSGSINVTNTPRHLEKMPEAQRAKVVQAIQSDSRFSAFLHKAVSVSKAAGNGIADGVTGTVKDLKDGLVATGEFLGENAAILVHGKEGEWVDHAVQKTQWIRDGLEAVKGTAEVIIDNGVKDTLTNSANYWSETYDEARAKSAKMSAEEIAYTTGNVTGRIATTIATGYALRSAQTISALNKEISFGSGIAARTANWVISNGGQIGVEYFGGWHLKSAHRAELIEVQKLKSAIKNYNQLHARASAIEDAIESIRKSAATKENKMAIFTQIRGLEIELGIVNKKMSTITDGLQVAGANFSVVAGQIVTEGLEKNMIHQAREAIVVQKGEEKHPNAPKNPQKTLADAGVRSLDRVKEFCTSLWRECSEIRTAMSSSVLTQSTLQTIRTTLAEKRNIVNHRLDDLKRLGEKIEGFKSADITSSEALKNISASVSLLSRELAGLTRLEKDLNSISSQKFATA